MSLKYVLETLVLKNIMQTSLKYIITNVKFIFQKISKFLNRGHITNISNVLQMFTKIMIAIIKLIFR